ncbi:hypothetical protein [Capnocytophaga catalasegens]|uniref:Uncharacterized protein n=1 Tax=Capnocytophaga catalasegens TaxID=1004260 RepID=A0AAV5AWA4_9FLAO|nr:hypothetical protein [Capnocytophaga catalasegens]GIZ16116.1 hypothetical protein RCZ03_21160 [Capnocytophaga catalasegens]GJM51536.1 hypothetical protein RCZ15_25090 [Capnocytophaga catalasegens]GJM52891.1 hypothetical protein RCZ16_12080 [Capnocytophaga catalasegens]
MKTNQEILNEFGRELIENSYDFNFNLFKRNIEKNISSEKDRKKILSLFKENIESILFNILKLFEENEEFKLIYEKDGKQINLVEISEMLKAEPLGENGWIKRFSKYADEYEV